MTVREGWRRWGWKACGGVKMGCIMTPMPNHLSTHPYYYISLPLDHKTTQNSVEMVSGVVWEWSR